MKYSLVTDELLEKYSAEDILRIAKVSIEEGVEPDEVSVEGLIPEEVSVEELTPEEMYRDEGMSVDEVAAAKGATRREMEKELSKVRKTKRRKRPRLRKRACQVCGSVFLMEERICERCKPLICTRCGVKKEEGNTEDLCCECIAELNRVNGKIDYVGVRKKITGKELAPSHIYNSGIGVVA